MVFFRGASLLLIAQLSYASVPVVLSSPYAPVSASCPSDPLVRPAGSIAPAEASFVQGRSTKAASALNTWLSSLNAGFGNFSTSSAPVLAASYSGGGFHALLNGAGNRQEFDARDSNSSVAGIYQALTYESSLSGGAWFLAGIANDGYPTISYLIKNFYLPNIQNGLLEPGGLVGTGPNDVDILLHQVQSKQTAGYEVNLVDFYGRLLGYNLLSGTEGGVSKHFSDVVHGANFSSNNVPFPILTSIGINDTGTRCSDIEDTQQAQMEITPFEFGSWDPSIHAFTQTKYLGTRLRAGVPSTGKCTTGYDNTGFMQATSGNILPAVVCAIDNGLPSELGNDVLDLFRTLQQLLLKINGTADAADIAGASYPNPFYGYSGVSPAYSSGSELYLEDGAFNGQNDPIWPHLHRNVSTLFTVDDSGNISSLYASYAAAKTYGLTRMPVIPEVAAYDNATMPRFFGCHQPQTMTVVWLAGFNYVYPNSITALDLQLSAEQIEGLLANGRASATGNGDKNWGVCVACAILVKTDSKLPEACAACLDKYCWN